MTTELGITHRSQRARVVLRDGSAVLIRPVQRTDAGAWQMASPG
jgi:hypothetical protein